MLSKHWTRSKEHKKRIGQVEMIIHVGLYCSQLVDILLIHEDESDKSHTIRLNDVKQLSN